MERDSRIFLAGHRGLVGSAVHRRLTRDGYTNLLTRSHAELDLTNQNAVSKFFESEKPEYVFLCAGHVGGILANSTYKADFIYDNLAIGMNVVHSAFKTKVQKLVNLGSSCIYPRNAPQPMKEESLLTGELELTNEPYAIAKIAVIKLCRYYDVQYGTNFVSLMPTNLFGPNDNFNLELGHVMPALLRKFYLAKLLQEHDTDALLADIKKYPIGFGLDHVADASNMPLVLSTLERLGIRGDSVVIWGTGSPYREFLHVDDLADASLHIMNNLDAKELGELINVGTGQDQRILDIASLVKETVGFKGEIRFDRSKPDGTPRKLLDVGKLSRLGWTSKISLEEGLRRTFEWYTATRESRHHAAS
jgi:GDP-L-fucose synthase